MSDINPELAVSRQDFLSDRMVIEKSLIAQGYTFAGNIVPPRISGISYEEQERTIAESAGTEGLEVIGDVMSTYDSDPELRELRVVFDYAAVYAPPKAT